MKLGARILVVDDEPIVRDAIRQLLTHAGHKVEAVDNGAAALKLLANRKFDVVMTDFAMPGMHGDQLVTRIRQLLPHQHIVMATAFVDEYEIFGQAGGGVDAVLLKPFSFKDLLETIERVLATESLETPITMPPLPNRHRAKK